MKSKLGFGYLIAFAIFAFLIIIPSAKAVNITATVTVNVNISSVGAIVVTPNAFSWTTGILGSLAPGTDSGVQTLVIKNIGSVNVSQIFMNASTVSDESVNPITTKANASGYSAAGLIFIKNTSATTYAHAGRIEWNISSVLVNETLNLDSKTNNFSHGWYRNASGNEFLWKLENGTNGYCNETGTTFNIKLYPENATMLNRDLSSDLSTCGAVTAGSGWGLFTCTDGPFAGQCVATHKNCDKIYVYKYSKLLTDYPNCNNAAYLGGTIVIPGDEVDLNLFASIPKGMPAGDTKTGTLTIFAGY